MENVRQCPLEFVRHLMGSDYVIFVINASTADICQDNFARDRVYYVMAHKTESVILADPEVVQKEFGILIGTACVW